MSVPSVHHTRCIWRYEQEEKKDVWGQKHAYMSPLLPGKYEKSSNFTTEFSELQKQPRLSTS